MRGLKTWFARSAKWKWLAALAVLMYVVGPKPHAEWRDSAPVRASEAVAVRGVNVPEHRHVALYLTTPRLRLFDVGYSEGKWSAQGFGVETAPPWEYRFVPPSPP